MDHCTDVFLERRLISARLMLSWCISCCQSTRESSPFAGWWRSEGAWPAGRAAWRAACTAYQTARTRPSKAAAATDWTGFRWAVIWTRLGRTIPRTTRRPTWRTVSATNLSWRRRRSRNLLIDLVWRPTSTTALDNVNMWLDQRRVSCVQSYEVI